MAQRERKRKCVATGDIYFASAALGFLFFLYYSPLSFPYKEVLHLARLFISHYSGPDSEQRMLIEAPVTSSAMYKSHFMKILKRTRNIGSSHGNRVPRWCENNPFQVVQLPIGAHDAN
jgi:hypothetical protein